MSNYSGEPYSRRPCIVWRRVYVFLRQQVTNIWPCTANILHPMVSRLNLDKDGVILQCSKIFYTCFYITIVDTLGKSVYFNILKVVNWNAGGLKIISL